MMINIEVNGKKIKAQQGSMIIEAADEAGIHIPRFCYHKKLSIAANCRMCLVEVEKAPKPMPACATPITDGMQISTRSEKATAAQKAVMEFLLINHPLDCPICDQGGECELQDLSMGYGSDTSLFTEGKRSVHDEDLGSLISSDMTRCIHCTRCVRFGQEVAGIPELGATGRGEDMEITTYVKASLKSEMSGNIIDLCPVGALTSKPYRFIARAWEMLQRPSIAPHDCIGSNINVHVRRNEVMRVVPKDNEDINEVWLSDRDRFSYCGLNSDNRLEMPLIKYQGEWKETDWATAFEFLVEGLRKTKEVFGDEQLGAFISPSSTIEEMYLLQKIIRVLGSNNIDHRVRQSDFSDQNQMLHYLGLPISLNELENQDAIVLIGSNIQREQPIAAHRIRKATLNNECQVVSINSVDYHVNFPLTHKIIAKPSLLPTTLAGIIKALLNKTPEASIDDSVHSSIQAVEPNEEQAQIADLLIKSKNKIILLGALAINHPQAAMIRIFTDVISKLAGVSIGYFTEGANSAGAWIAGAVPHRNAAGIDLETAGQHARDMLSQPLKMYLLFNLEPECDFANPALATQALIQAEYVVAFAAFKSEYLLQHTDVILPITPFTETSGTYVNAQGDWQSFDAVTKPLADVKPGWKILRVLGNYFKLEGFDYTTSDEIRDELQQLIQEQQSNIPSQQTHLELNKPLEFDVEQTSLTRITEWPIYRTDALVRHSQPLQQSATNEPLGIYVNQKTASQYALTENEVATVKQQEGNPIELQVHIDNRIADDCLAIPGGFVETAELGDAFAGIEIVKN